MNFSLKDGSLGTRGRHGRHCGPRMCVPEIQIRTMLAVLLFDEV